MESMTLNLTFPCLIPVIMPDATPPVQLQQLNLPALPEHSKCTLDKLKVLAMGKRGEKKNGKKTEVAGRKEEELFPYVYAPECEKEKEITSSFRLRSQMPL